MAQATHGAVLAAGLEAQNPQCLRDHHLLLLVVGWRDAFEDLEALKSGGAAGRLVRDHAPHGLVEDARRGSEMEGTWPGVRKNTA